ncbi:MAG: DNA repair exonuclease [Acidipropionibacterium sp.]|jgi:DNA repair exonuclease SbcCD nuclease subunit|nr:DNA repair exonuclease [Acidipropionibacterium sp.]
MTLRFLHTSDWQLGMTRHYLARRHGCDDDPQARFSSDRIDAVRRIGELARTRDCAFVVVAGDVFETQNVSRQVISRTCSAMASIGLPVFLLPGNHDSLEPGCIWDRPDFTEACPANVTVLRSSTPVKVADGVEIAGVPLKSRHPSSDPIAPVLSGLKDDGVTRIVVAHGQLPGLSGQDAEEDVTIDKQALDDAVQRGAVSYIALGDRHIRWPEDPASPIRYSGTHETTRFSDPGRGTVDLVEIEDGRINATALPVGRWLHARVSRQMSTDEDIDALAAEFATFDDPPRTIIRYDLHGGLTVARNARLETLLEGRGRELRQPGAQRTPP